MDSLHKIMKFNDELKKPYVYKYKNLEDLKRQIVHLPIEQQQAIIEQYISMEKLFF